MPLYAESLIKEIRIANQNTEKISLHSIYFGGGTPSLMALKDFEKVLEAIRQSYELTADCEISLEANPGTLHADYLRGLHALGFNRLSLGVQSTDSFDLARLDRIHSIQDVLAAVWEARRAGFTNINLDLIFGLPWQDLDSWQNSLQRAIDLQPEHFSLYALIIEEGTALYRWDQKGLIEPQDQDLQADMYELAMAMLAEAGYQQYEISNWAKQAEGADLRCRHNMQYWLNDPYIGVGAGAQGYFDHLRLVNTPNLTDYINRMRNAESAGWALTNTPATVSSEFVDPETRMMDEMMLGLRLVQQGVGEGDFQRRYDASMAAVFESELNRLIGLGLLEWVDTEESRRVRLTHHGTMVANQVFMAFV